MIHFLKNLHRTFYCTDFYRELVTSWKGIGLGFLLITTLINVGHMSIIVQEPLRLFLDEQEAIFESLPSITIKDGVISTDTEGPHNIVFLKDYEEGTINVVIDTKAEPLDPVALTKKMKEEQVLVYIDKSSITIYDPIKNLLETKEARSLDNQIVSHEDWIRASHLIKTTFIPTVVLIVLASSFLGHLITAFLGALFLLIIAPLFKADFTLAGAIRLAAAAKVPVAVIFLILMPQPAMQALVWAGFALFGLLANKKTQNAAK